MTPPVYVTSFKANDRVPEWLIYSDPTTPEAIPCDMRFTHNTAIIEYCGRYYLLPDELSASSVIHIPSGDHCVLGAASKTVVMPIDYLTMLSQQEMANNQA